MIKKSKEELLAEIEYIQDSIYERELEIFVLRNKKKELEKELEEKKD